MRPSQRDRRRSAPPRRFRHLVLEQLEVRALLAGIIELGPSDNIALDQPRVAMELIKDVDPGPGEQWESVGPSIFNTFLLDTGANSVLAMATAVADMGNPPIPYETEYKYEELGVGGTHEMDISAVYRLDFAGTSGVRNTLPDTRILSDPDKDFSIFGPWGIVGMPAMVNRVTSFDMTGWSGGGTGLEDLYMKVAFAGEVPAETVPPAESHRYKIQVDNDPSFDVSAGQVNPGDPFPVWADVPFLTATPTHHGVGQEGSFLLDTGAQISVISPELAIDIGLDSSGDGELDEDDDSFVTRQQVGGVGGMINAPVFAIDEVHVPAKRDISGEDVELVWTDLQWLVLDIHPSIHGVFGQDLITSGWFHAFFYPGQPDGYIDKVHLDFREMENGTGTVYLDLNESVDKVIEPGPGIRIRETARSTDVAEGGNDDTYSVVLGSEPTANVTITLGNTDGQVTAVNDADQSNQLVFTSADWSTPKIVRVAAVDDTAAEGSHTGLITHVVDSADNDYGTLTLPDLTVNVADDDLNLMTFSSDAAGQSVITTVGAAEGGGDVTYWVALNSQPENEIWLLAEDVTGQAEVVNASNAALENILVFSTSNWHVPQAYNLTAVDDADQEGPHEAKLTHSVVDFLANPPVLGQTNLPVNITDNDLGGVVITETDGGTVITEAGGTDTYQIALATVPAGAVEITVSADAQTRVSVDGGPFEPQLVLSLTDTTAKAITVGAVDDAVDEANHTGKITHAVTGTVNDQKYPTTLSIDDVTAAITDNDSAGLRITEDQQGQNVITSVNVAEGGAEVTYWVALTSEPKAEVTVFLGSIGGQVTTNAANQSTKLVFTSTDWNIPQTVHVNAVDDDVVEGAHSDKIDHNAVSGDPDYRGNILLAASITDNDSDSDNDGINDGVEAAAPNNGDGNRDGTPDSQQNHVASFPNAADGSYVTLAAPAGMTLVGVTTTGNPSPNDSPQGVNFPVGFFDYVIEGVGVGGSAVVNVYPESGSVVNTYYQYGPTGDDPADHWYPFMYDGQTGAIIHADRIELHFVDGRRGDDDLLADGRIVDPGAPGGTQFPWQNSALPEDVNCDTLVTTLDVLTLIADINSGGLGPLPATMDGSRIHTHYPDVDPNNELSPHDVLMTILYINAQAGGNPEGESPGPDPRVSSSGLLTDVAGQISETAALPHPVLAAAKSPYGRTVTVDTIGHSEPPRSSLSEPRSRFAFPSVGWRDAIRQTDVDRSPRINANDQASVLVDDSDLDSILDDIVPDVQRIWRTD